MSIDAWCNLQTRAELISKLRPILKHTRLTNMGKDDIIKAVEHACKPKNDISKYFIKQGKKPLPDTAAKLQIEKLCEEDNFIKIDIDAKSIFNRLFHLMYAGINPQILREKRLNLLLLNIKRGLQHFPAMNNKCDSVACVFPSRQYFEEYVNACIMFDNILKGITDKKYFLLSCYIEDCVKKLKCFPKTIVEFNPPVWQHRFSPYYHYYKGIELSIPKVRNNFESIDSYKEFECTMYSCTLQLMLDEKNIRVYKKPLWYTELITCLWKKRNHQEAAKYLIRALLNTTFSSDDRAPLCDKAQRLAQMKSAKIDVETRERLLELSYQICPEIPHTQICGKMIESGGIRNKRVQYKLLDRSSGNVMFAHVEDLAIHHYITNKGYAQGEHWENSITTSLFVLTFWDIIYCDMPGRGIFLSPYQELPLDIYTSAFYINRKDLIDERLAIIKNYNIEQIIDMMKTTYDSRKPGDFSLYNDNISWDVLPDVIKCLGSEGLHAIVKRLAIDPYQAHSGFPDVTLWDAVTKKIKFVEVKSHNDKLSFKQIKWMEYLIEHNIDTEVCFVSPNETNIDVFSKINKRYSSSMEEVKRKQNDKGGKGKKRKMTMKEKVLVTSLLGSMEEDEDISPSENEDTLQKHYEKKNPNKIRKKINQRNTATSKIEINQPDTSTSNDVSQITRSQVNQTSTVDIINSSPSKRLSRPTKHSLRLKKLPPKHETQSNINEDAVYLRSPNKYSKGVGYLTSPNKSPATGTSTSNSRSPYKNLSPKAKISLSLTRRRLTDFDK